MVKGVSLNPSQCGSVGIVMPVLVFRLAMYGYKPWSHRYLQKRPPTVVLLVPATIVEQQNPVISAGIYVDKERYWLSAVD